MVPSSHPLSVAERCSSTVCVNFNVDHNSAFVKRFNGAMRALTLDVQLDFSVNVTYYEIKISRDTVSMSSRDRQVLPYHSR